MALRSPGLRRGAALVLAPLIALGLVRALSAASQAADYDGDIPGFGSSKYEEPVDGGENGRRSTWELNTSLTFYRYLEPFQRVDSARACRDRCADNRHCTGWTYYDANFNEAGRLSPKLQRLCVLGAGVRHKQSGNRPGRTSGVLRKFRQDSIGGAGG